MQEYARAAKSLLDNVAKLTIRQLPSAGDLQQQHPLCQLQVQASTSPRLNGGASGASASAPSGVQASAPSASVPIEARVSRFKQELLASRVNLPALRRLAFHGIPDRDGLRAVTWKLLLGYLPPDPAEWDTVLSRRRAQYAAFCRELIVDPKDGESGGGEGGGGGGGGGDGAPSTSGRGGGAAAAACSPPRAGAPVVEGVRARGASDHPLALHATSKWATFFKDAEVMEQIDRDVMRTHPDMHFFSGDTPAAEAHRAELKRALFLYAKLNPGLRYIQGMNELLAPLYYLFATDPDESAARYAEADAFFCFVDLLSEFRDHFCQQLDNSSSGIKATIARLMALLRSHDPQLADHLEANKVDPQFFAFRWITLLLTQEFAFPDAVRIWDTLLADPAGRADCLLRVCTALLVSAREPLLGGDFAQNVKLLQRYPAVDVAQILRLAEHLALVGGGSGGGGAGSGGEVGDDALGDGGGSGFG